MVLHLWVHICLLRVGSQGIREAEPPETGHDYVDDGRKGMDVSAAKEMSVFERISTPQVTMSNADIILSAATRVFLNHGYGGARMDLVAKEAGLARRTVYNQFPDGKEALFRAVVQRMWSAFETMNIASDEAALSDPAVGLRRIGYATAEFWRSPLAIRFLRMVIGEGMRFPDLTQSFFEFGKTPSMEATRDYLSELSRRGLLIVENPELATRQFIGLIDEPLLWVRVVGKDESHSDKERRDVVEQAVSIFLGYYSVEKKNRAKK